MNTNEYKTGLVRILKKANGQTKSLDPITTGLSGILKTLELCRRCIDTLEDPYVWERTRYGEKMMQHPVFVIQRDAVTTLIKGMKALGLTTADLSIDEEEDDELVKMTKKVMLSCK